MEYKKQKEDNKGKRKRTEPEKMPKQTKYSENTAQKENISNRNESNILKKRYIKKVDEEKVKEAGLMRIAPGTPVAKLKEKIQNAMSSINKARNEEIESVLCQRNLSNTSVVVLQDKLCEAEALANLCGITVARKYFEALPNESGLERVTEQPLYWLSWIKLENTSEGQNKVEVIKSLYERALASVKGHASHVALQTAFDCFVETCGKELNKSVRSRYHSFMRYIPSISK